MYYMKQCLEEGLFSSPFTGKAQRSQLTCLESQSYDLVESVLSQLDLLGKSVRAIVFQN